MTCTCQMHETLREEVKNRTLVGCHGRSRSVLSSSILVRPASLQEDSNVMKIGLEQRIEDLEKKFVEVCVQARTMCCICDVRIPARGHAFSVKCV